jgi:peptide deformylase
MDILTLIPERDIRLHKPVPVFVPSEHPDEDIKAVAAALQATRRAHKAHGLAANQVGLNLRMFVMGSDFAEFVCINPEIISHNNVTVLDTEGCLSFPKLFLKVPRCESVTVKYFDEDLKEVNCEFKGTFARCFQHELDHLNGITFNSKVSRLVLAMAMKKRQEKQRFR